MSQDWMPKLAPWELDPDAPHSAEQASSAHSIMALGRKLAEIAGVPVEELTDEMFGDLLEEVKHNKSIMAIAEADAVESMGKTQAMFDQALILKAIAATKSGLHAYHPEKFGSVAEMLEAKLACLDEKRQASDHSYLVWLAEVFVPACEEAGVSGLGALWQEGGKSKSRALIDLLRKHDKFDPQNVDPTLINGMLADVADKKVSVGGFKEKYGKQFHQSSMLGVDVYEYDTGDSRILVMRVDPLQYSHVKSSIEAQFHVGTAKDPVLGFLPKKASHCDDL